MASYEKMERHARYQMTGLGYWLGEAWEWGGVFIAFLTLEVSLLSVEKANWITPQPPLTLILISALLTAWLLVKSRLPAALSHLSALILGIMITAWQASSLLSSPETLSRGDESIVNLRGWWQLIATTSPSKGTTGFATFLILFTWLATYLSIWSILKKQNAWVAVLLSGATILVNLANLTEEYHSFFFLYLVFALFLLGSMNLARNLKRFQKNRIPYPRWGMAYPVILLLCLSLLTTLVSWQIPQVRLEGLETWVSKKITWRESLKGHPLNLFAEVPSKQPAFTGSRQRELSFRDSFHRGENIHFVIISERPAYWRTQVYDTCNAWGWSVSPTSPPAGEGQASHQKNFPLRRELTYTVETMVKTGVLLIAGDFASCNIPTSAETLSPRICNIDLTNPAYDSFLPEDVALFARSLRTAQAGDRISGPGDIKKLLPPELLLTGIGRSRLPPTEANYGLMVADSWLTNIEVTTKRERPIDAVAVLTEPPIEANQSYTATTNITTATASDLASGGGDYPSWITDYYLKIPPGLPDRVWQLAKAITVSAPSAYKKVMAIKYYLSQLPYDENVASPPEKADGVDYFLFMRRSGNCSYFASALAILLRLNGVPARLCTGYLPGEWDQTSGRFTVRAKHYHAWVEAYFPGYGWIEFEATPETTGGIAGLAEEESPGQPYGSSTTPSDERGETGIPSEDIRKDSETEALIKNLAVQERPTITPEIELKLPLTIGIVFAALLVIALVSAFYGWLWHFTGPDYGSEVYAKMCFLASWVRLRPRPQQTPLEYGAMLTAALPLQAEPILGVIQTYQLSQYGGRKELAAWQAEHLESSWQKVYIALVKRLLRPG